LRLVQLLVACAVAVACRVRAQAAALLRELLGSARWRTHLQRSGAVSSAMSWWHGRSRIQHAGGAMVVLLAVPGPGGGRSSPLGSRQRSGVAVAHRAQGVAAGFPPSLLAPCFLLHGGRFAAVVGVVLALGGGLRLCRPSPMSPSVVVGRSL
jgi:hypothetical protein